MPNRIRFLACVCAILEIAATSALANAPSRNRRAFAAAMSKVQEGMSQAEVIALVGKPDDVTTQKDWERCLCRCARNLAIWGRRADEGGYAGTN